MNNHAQHKMPPKHVPLERDELIEKWMKMIGSANATQGAMLEIALDIRDCLQEICVGISELRSRE